MNTLVFANIDLPFGWPFRLAAFLPPASRGRLSSLVGLVFRAHEAVDSLRSEMRGRRALEHEREVRIRNRIITASAGCTRLQGGGWWIRFERRVASIARQEAHCAVDLKASGRGNAERGAAVHVPRDRGMGQFDVVCVSAPGGRIRWVHDAFGDPVVGRLHIQSCRKIGGGRFRV